MMLEGVEKDIPLPTRRIRQTKPLQFRIILDSFYKI
jgi:hypothetical protein